MADRNGYIGRAPGDNSVIIARQTFNPTGIQTDFTFSSGYTPGYLDVYLNGVRLIEANDYTATDNSIVGLTSAAQNGDVLEMVAYKAFNVVAVDEALGDFTVGNNLTVNGNVTVTGDHGDISARNFTGVAATFTGNVSIGGSLIYEDVYNVDSLGIITARSGIEIGSPSIASTLTAAGGASFSDLVTGTSFSGTDGSFTILNGGANNAFHVDGGAPASSLTLTNTGVTIASQFSSGNVVLTGISSIANVTGSTLNATGVSTFSNVVVGGATTELVVTGDTRITGILTVGTSSFTINGAHEYPTIRPTLDINFAATKTLDRRITFTRDGVGTFTDELGIVRYASNNTPRFNHDPTTGESLGLLIEEARTNIQRVPIFRASGGGNRFSINSTSAQIAGENTNGVIGPNGTATNVCRAFFTGNESDPDGSVYVFAFDGSLGASYTTTNTHTSSVWIRPGLETVWNMKAHSAYASASAGGAGTTIDFIFTLTGEGTVTSIESGGISASVQKYPNNWYRCNITYHRNSTATVGTGFGVILYPTVYTSYNAQSETGDIGWFWGPQVEAGAFATSYIPTSRLTVTRGADVAGIKGTNFTDFYNQTEGTIFSNLVPLSDSVGNSTGTGSVYWSINANSGFGDGIYLSNGTGSTIANLSGYVSSSSQLSSVNSSTISNGSDTKFVHVYKQNDFIGATNGTLTSADTSGNLATNVRLVIGNNAWGGTDIMSNSLNAANAHVKRFSYYPKRLPNAQLQGLTAP